MAIDHSFVLGGDTTVFSETVVGGVRGVASTLYNGVGGRRGVSNHPAYPPPLPLVEVGVGQIGARIWIARSSVTLSTV